MTGSLMGFAKQKPIVAFAITLVALAILWSLLGAIFGTLIFLIKMVVLVALLMAVVYVIRESLRSARKLRLASEKLKK